MNRVLRMALLAFAFAIFLVYMAKARGIDYKAFFDFLQFLILPWIVMILIACTGFVFGNIAISLINFQVRKKSDKKNSDPPFIASGGERLIFTTGIGLALLSIIVWGIGWIKLLYAPILFPILIIVPILGRRSMSELKDNLIVIWKDLKSFRGFELALVIAIFVWIARTMFLATNPSIGHDPIALHLYAPKVYLENHGIVYKLLFPFLQLHGMLALLQMTVSKDPGSVLPYTYMLMIGGLLYLIGKNWFNKTTGLFSALFYMLIPMSHYSATYHLNEHLLVFYLVLAFYAVLKFKDDSNEKWLTLAGISCGAACGTDINGLFPTVLIAVIALRGWWRILLWAFITATPWYVFNIIYYGNPIFPFYENLFKWANWGLKEADTVFSSYNREGSLAKLQGESTSNWWDKFTVLFRYTFEPSTPWEQRPVGRIGPFILALTPAIFFAPMNKTVKTIGIFILAGYGYWLFLEGVYNARFMLYIFVFHGLLCAWALTWILDHWKVNWNLHKWIILVALFAFATAITLNYSGRMIYVTYATRHLYVFFKKPGYIHFEAVNKLSDQVKPHAYLLGLDGYRFYADFEISGASYGPDNEQEYYLHSNTPKELYDWLLTFGCNLLIINRDYLTNNNLGIDFGKVMEHPDWDTYFEYVPVVPNEEEIQDIATHLYMLKKTDAGGTALDKDKIPSDSTYNPLGGTLGEEDAGEYHPEREMELDDILEMTGGG